MPTTKAMMNENENQNNDYEIIDGVSYPKKVAINNHMYYLGTNKHTGGYRYAIEYSERHTDGYKNYVNVQDMDDYKKCMEFKNKVDEKQAKNKKRYETLINEFPNITEKDIQNAEKNIRKRIDPESGMVVIESNGYQCGSIEIKLMKPSLYLRLVLEELNNIYEEEKNTDIFFDDEINGTDLSDEL